MPELKAAVCPPAGAFGELSLNIGDPGEALAGGSFLDLVKPLGLGRLPGQSLKRKDPPAFSADVPPNPAGVTPEEVSAASVPEERGVRYLFVAALLIQSQWRNPPA